MSFSVKEEAHTLSGDPTDSQKKLHLQCTCLERSSETLPNHYPAGPRQRGEKCQLLICLSSKCKVRKNNAHRSDMCVYMYTYIYIHLNVCPGAYQTLSMCYESLF